MKKFGWIWFIFEREGVIFCPLQMYLELRWLCLHHRNSEVYLAYIATLLAGPDRIGNSKENVFADVLNITEHFKA
jgi:hypothetical protein